MKKKRVYSFENISKDSSLFRKATGREVDCFRELFSFLNLGDNCGNIKFYEPSKEQVFDSLSSSDKKSGPKPKLSPVNHLFLLLVWLKNGITLSYTSWLFDTSKSTVSRYLITWINFLYFSLGSLPIWPSKEKYKRLCQKVFKGHILQQDAYLIVLNYFASIHLL